MENHDPPAADEGSTQAPRGSLSALLRELAADPVGSFERDWQRWLAPGETIGRFRLLRELGRGGFGVVFEAQDTALGRRVALKAVRTGKRASLSEERLVEEAEAAARLSHPNIVTVFDFGRTEKGPYLVLEFLHGQTLAARLDSGGVSVHEAVQVATQVARGLAHAHDRGVVHRDLKPGNVFLCGDGAVKVLDFGLAHAFGHRRVGGGTPAFMAPEQWSGAPEDERTDVFALGLILYQMLSGRHPFPGDDEGKALLAAAPAPALEVTGAPALGGLVGRMLEKDPVRRPRDGAEVLRALEAVSEQLAHLPGAAAGPVRTRRRPRLRLAAFVAIGVALGAGALGGAIALRGRAERGAAAGGRLVVAVADFANETGEPELDALSGLLITSLEQSPRLEVLGRGRLLDLLRPGGSDRLDERRAREAARLAHAGALVVTRLHRLGETYVAEVRVIEPSSGVRLFSLAEQQGRREMIPDLLDRVSERVRLGLGEELTGIRATSIRIAQSVTPSPEAWGYYTRGMACAERLEFAAGFDACLAELRKAVAVDPEFALAHLLVAQLSFSQGLPRAAQQAALEPALRLVGKIPPRDRIRVRGWAAFLDGNDVEAKSLLRQAAEEAGDDKLAWWWAGERTFHRDEYAEAASALWRVHELDPLWVEPTEHLVTALGCAGDLDGLRNLARGLESLGRSPMALANLCAARLWIEPDRAVATCEEAVAAGAGLVGDRFLAIALLNRGERGRLRAHLRSISRGEPPNTFGPFMSVLLDTQEGRWPVVLARLEAAGDPDDSWFSAGVTEALFGLGDPARIRRAALRTVELDRALASSLSAHHAYLGDLASAAEFAPYLQASSPRADTYRALTRWRQGDLRGAIEDLRAIAAKAPLSADPANPHPIYLLGEALVEAGHDAEAIDVLRRFQAMPLTYPTWLLPRSHYHLARAQERSGDLGGARETAGALLRLWEKASPDQPLLAEARAMGARLGLR